MNRKDPPVNERSPITILTVVLVMTWAVLAGLGLLSYRSYHETKTTTERRLRIEELRASIVHLEEVLTMSARMAAFTGDLEWENRYRRFEPRLDAAINEAMRLGPEAYSSEAAAETGAAHIKLVEMENRAFDLVRQGRQDEAGAILFSEEHEAQEQIYAQGMTRFAKPKERYLRLTELRGIIVHLDEVLTMSARSAAATGDLRWEERYRLFEPQLDTAIKEAIALAPGAHSGQAAAETDAAHIKLVEMENQAFDLLRQGRAEEAKAVLFSDEYKSQKQVYAKGMDAFAAGLADSVRTALKREQRKPFLLVGAKCLLMPFLIVGWVVVFRAVRNWKTTLAKRAEELVEVNESLDQKVAERTEALQKEVVERKQAEQLLRRSEAKHRILFESSRDAIMTLAPPSWKFTSGNPATLEMFATRDEAEFVSLGPWELSPEFQPDGRPSGEKAKEMIEAAMKEGSNFFEWQHQRLHGEEFPATVLLTRVELDGQVFLQATVRDFCEQKQAQEKLRAISDSALDAIIMMDSGGNVAHWNPAAEKMFGYSSKEIMGRGVHEVLAPNEYREQATRGLAGFAKSGKGPAIGKTLDLEAQRKDGSRFPIEMSMSPIKLEDRWWAVGIVRDITEQKLAERELHEAKNRAEAATHAKSCFLANMSHEIRTPMTAILGFTDMLLENIEKPEALEAAQVVKRNGERLLQLINDILDISKIEAGKAEVELIPWSPRQVVADVVSLLHGRAFARGLTLADEYPGPLPETVTTDPARLRQTLINLVGNAIKFTETGGVRIVTHLVDDPGSEPKLRFDVIDTGIGIPEDQIENVFEPFTQADGSNSRQYEGTGLGLAISRRFAGMLGGEITTKSDPGKGSTFTLTIATGPLDGIRLVEYLTGAPPASEEPVESPREFRGKLRCRVLLAEDVPDNQRLISAVLRESGAVVTIAQNGREAVQMALAARPGRGRRNSDPSEPFDVILMDVQMPVLDGYEATRQLRYTGYTDPIIALTAHAMQGDYQKCLDAGCDDYLTKPADRKKLVETVAKWASKEREQAATAVETDRGGEETKGMKEQASCSPGDQADGKSTSQAESPEGDGR